MVCTIFLTSKDISSDACAVYLLITWAAPTAGTLIAESSVSIRWFPLLSTWLEKEERDLWIKTTPKSSSESTYIWSENSSPKRYKSLGHTRVVDSTFRVIWLVAQLRISLHYSPPDTNKMASRFVPVYTDEQIFC